MRGQCEGRVGQRHAGTYGRTTDGGKTWSVGAVPGAEKLDFRDVEAFGETTAYLLDAGPGEASRIYKTRDGGKSWVMQFKNRRPRGLFDAIAFWDEKNGIALGDPVKGRFQLMVTDDGGRQLETARRERACRRPCPVRGPSRPAAPASSPTASKDVWFCTGGARSARVFHSTDRGRTWEVSETPIARAARPPAFSRSPSAIGITA